jgi:hypothetical protein
MILSPRLRQKIKYNGFLRILHDGFVKTGFKISLFYLVEEGLRKEMPEFELQNFPDYKLSFLDESEAAMLSSIPERPVSVQKLRKILAKGCICLSVKKENEIAAYTFIDPNECTYGSYRLPMKKNEACLFGAYTLLKYRGKNLAPFVRYQCYKELDKLGKHTIYSISELINNQSISFKKKLGARFVMLGLYISIFKKIKLAFPIKHLSS